MSWSELLVLEPTTRSISIGLIVLGSTRSRPRNTAGLVNVLNVILIALGVIAIGSVLWRALAARDRRSDLESRHSRHGGGQPDTWLRRLERIQLVSLILGVACIPVAYVVMVLTGSGILTITVGSGFLAGGFAFGICEIAKGIIEAKDIIGGGGTEK